jgi:hypothetical protein
MSRVRKIYTHTRNKNDVSPLGSTMVSLVNMTRTSCSNLARFVAYSTFFSAPKHHSGAQCLAFRSLVFSVWWLGFRSLVFSVQCLAFGVRYSVFGVLAFEVWYSMFRVSP